VFTTRYRLGL